jgi:multidrug efflux pump subunit AcrA (membrane-fusion protein)
MKEFFKSLYTNKKRLAVVVVIILIAGYFIYKHFNTASAQTTYVLGTATDQTIITSVSGTGQVSQDRDVNITPPTSGTLTAVDVTQGQAVKTGQTIAIVDETNNTIALNQAKAGLASAQANYDEVLAGATPQSIQLSQLTLQADQEALDNATTSLVTVTKQQNQDVANALSTLLSSNLQAIPSSGNGGNATIAISGSYNDTQQGTYTITAYNTGGGLEYVISGLETATGAINKTTPLPLGTKGLYMQFSGSIDNNDTWNVAIPNPLSSSYSGNENAYQTAITNQASAILSAQQQITSAQNKLQQDQINLQVQQEPPTSQR